MHALSLDVGHFIRWAPWEILNLAQSLEGFDSQIEPHHGHQVIEVLELILHLIELGGRHCCLLVFLISILLYDLVQVGLLNCRVVFLGALMDFLVKERTTE